MKKLLNTLKRTTLLTVGVSIFATSSVFAVNIGDTGVSINGYARWKAEVATPVNSHGKSDLNAAWATRIRYTIGGTHNTEFLDTKFIWAVNQSFETNSAASLDRLLYVGLQHDSLGKLLLGKQNTFMDDELTNGMVNGDLFGAKAYVYRYTTAIKYTTPTNPFGVEGLTLGTLFAFNPTGSVSDKNTDIKNGMSNKSTTRYPLGYEFMVKYAEADYGLDLAFGYAASHNQGNFSIIDSTQFSNYYKDGVSMFSDWLNGINKSWENFDGYKTVGNFNTVSSAKIGYNKDGISAGFRYAYKYSNFDIREINTGEQYPLTFFKSHIYGAYVGLTFADVHTVSFSAEYIPNFILFGQLFDVRTSIISASYENKLTSKLSLYTDVNHKFAGRLIKDEDNTIYNIYTFGNTGKQETTVSVSLKYNF